MKKLLSFVLTLCMCLSFAATFTACGGGEGNPYQEYLKSFNQNNGKHLLEKIEGSSNEEHVTDYFELTGSLELYGMKRDRNSFGVSSLYVTDRKTNDVGTMDDSEAYSYMKMSYVANSSTLSVEVMGYFYQTNASEVIEKNGTSYEWTDGFGWRYISGENIPIAEFDFNIDKYFENGKLTPEDATIVKDFDESRLSENRKDLVDSITYTERNPEWKTAAMKDIVNAINATLAEIDKIMIKAE